MPIDGVNTAMTTLQFARARSATRSVETAEHSHARAGTSSALLPSIPADPRPSAPSPSRVESTIPPASFHFTYRPIPGKAAAKRLLQLADSAYWSFSLNHLG